MKIHPPVPATTIPELSAMMLTQKAYFATVAIACEASRIEEELLHPSGGPNLRWRIEVAAAFLAAAINHARRSAEVTGKDPSYAIGLAIDLTVKRGEEIYGQGRA